MGFDLETALDSLLREQSSGDHHRGVRRVRARGDRGDDDRAVLQTDIPRRFRHGHGRRRCRPGSRSWARVVDRLRAFGVAGLTVTHRRRRRIDRRIPDLRKDHAVLRPLRTATDSSDRAEVDFNEARQTRRGAVRTSEEAHLGPRVASRPRVMSFRVARGLLEDTASVWADRSGRVRSWSPYSGHMFETVARSGTERLERPSPQNSTNLLTTPCFRSISVSVRTRSVAVVPMGS